jgi:hypothetical protein
LLRESYNNLAILRCPTDGPRPASQTNSVSPADAAPRTYIINGWNDYFAQDPTVWELFKSGSPSITLRENAIREPSETVLFGEKDYDSPHYYMDYEFYDDLLQLDQSKHVSGFKNSKGNGGGGSNHAFADGSVRFLRFWRALDPVNLWAIVPAVRNVGIQQ